MKFGTLGQYSKKKRYRILAFWDKTKKTNTLVVATHGIIKKSDKMQSAEIDRAKTMMKLYFDQKLKKN